MSVVMTGIKLLFLLLSGYDKIWIVKNGK